jgi:2-oxoisovalerate dehydrogenase E2 component (dihydrolipoyl transacylase)
VGSELVIIETEAAVIEKPGGVEPERKPRPVEKRETAKALASPAVRQRARELGIELQVVQGSGPSGRVMHSDLDTHLVAAGGRAANAERVPAAERKPAQPDAVEEIRIVGIRRKIAERMQEAYRRIPHFSYIEEVDVTALEELRHDLNTEHAGKRPKLTPLAFVMRAIVRAVAAHPEINARFDDEKGVLQRHAAVHIGIATQTPNGLLVPVVRHAEARDLWDCAAEAARLAAEAREGKATRSELTGSTITITSLGALGGLASTPIINYPEVAIVGVNRIAERPVVRDGQIAVRKMMNLSSSFDHRVIDGWNAAAFIQKLKHFLEQPATLFVE